MTQEHPITPPEELVDQWNEAWIDAKVKHEGLVTFIATQAARWGADMELEACVHYVDNVISGNKARALLAIRRPKPPSLKEQSIALIDKIQSNKEMWDIRDLDVIRRALEPLPD